MITAVFQNNDDYAHAYGLWQWDYGQQLRIEGLHLPTAVEIHFALQEMGGEAVPRVGVTKDGVTTVTIPDSMLEGNSTVWTAEKMYNIHAWIYLSDRTSGETIKRITMQVKSRPKPKAFEAPGDGEIFHQAIEAVNDAAKRAEDAGDKAIAAADEAEKAATQTAEHLEAVQGLAEQVETNADTVAQDKLTVTGMLSQTQQAASDAALSAQAAKLSETAAAQAQTAAAQAQTAAETAEDTARQYAEDTGADRQAVANDKQAVGEMREAVAEDRQAVEQTTTQFGQTAQDALTAIGQAQSTAVGSVKAEGNKQTTAVQEAGTQAVSEVAEAKTTAVEAVTAEGDKQTKRVEDAAAGIVADREQISQNKTDIAGLVEGMTDLAPAIHSTASGSVITANDAAEGRPFRGLRVFGRSTQVRTTGAQLFDAKTCLKSQIEKGVVSINSDGRIVLKGVIDANNRAFTITLQPGTYTLSADKPSIWHIIAPVDGVFNQKITADVETTYNCYIANGTYDNVETTPMINAGLSALPWEPYTGGKPSPSPEYPQEIVSAGEGGSVEVDVRGKNLLPFPYADGMTKTTNGITFTVNTDRSITCTGTAINQAFFNLNRQKYTENPTDFNKYYSAVDCRYDHSNNITHISVSKSEGYINKTIYPMVVKKGETNLEYEPPRIPQSLTLQTPNGLPGVPVSKDGNYTDENGQQWVCDEIDLERGKYVQRIETRILDGTEAWKHRITNSGNNNFQILINDRPSSAIHRSFCNYLPYKNFIWDDNIVNLPKIYSYDLEITASFPPESEFKSVEIWNSWLKEKGDFKFQYVLATPIERDLTPEEIAAYKALRTYGPTTVVSNDAGAGMEVTYVADTKAYIDKKFKELNQAIVNTQIALL